MKDRHRECRCGKRGYPSRGAAKRSMRSASNRVRVYRCAVTPTNWHVTSEVQSERRSW